MHADLALTASLPGYLVLAIFVVAYALVITEEYTHLRKSKPVVLAAGLIWLVIGLSVPEGTELEPAFRETLTEYAELMLFLLAAMSYVNAMTDRGVFSALRATLLRRRAGRRSLFWTTGILAFFLSAWIDNLTASLVMSGVVLAIARDSRYLTLCCINIVVAANAGGAWIPFGDITTLMVWQAGKLDFFEFFALFPASLVSWLLPAAAMHMVIPRTPLDPDAATAGSGRKRGARRVVLLFAATLATAIGFHSALVLPAVLGMMTGLGYLQIFGYYLKRTVSSKDTSPPVGEVAPVDVFRYVAQAEWDTLLFFYGIILCVGGLGTLGYLAELSVWLYGTLGTTTANVAIGAVSSVIDNIPVMAAVLEMNPAMSDDQWLLVTLAAGIGGSMLSIGSAAGVALMGQARGHYTFVAHLRWTPVIALGYLGGVMTHLWLTA